MSAVKYSDGVLERSERIRRALGLEDDESAPPPTADDDGGRRLSATFVCVCGRRRRAWGRPELSTRELIETLRCTSCGRIGHMVAAVTTRSRRARKMRAKTVGPRRMSRRELLLGRELYPTPEDAPPRPATRSECVDGERPCPFVSCRHHLYLDVTPAGSVKLNFPELEVDELGESCSLDVADRGPATLEHTGVLMNITRERVRQVEQMAFGTVRPRLPRDLQADMAGEAHRPRIHLPIVRDMAEDPCECGHARDDHEGGAACLDDACDCVHFDPAEMP